MPPVADRIRVAGAPLLAAVLAPMALLVPVLMSGHTLVWRDTAQLYAPHRPGIVEALRSLRLPTWNPLEGTGHPLFAQGLHSVLHPLSLAVAAFTSSTDALIVALVAFASAGTWAASRSLGQSPIAATTSAFAFSLSGYVLSMAGNALYLFGAASGPWVIWGLLTAARHRYGLVAAAAAVATLALSGDVGAMGAFLAMAAALVFAVAGARGLPRAALGAALGLGVAAVQLVPSWLYLAGTARGAGLLDPSSVRRWALAPARVLELCLPGLAVGRPRSYVAPAFAALDPSARDAFPFACSISVGIAVLLLAAAGVRWTRTGRWLGGLSLLFLWIALGHHAGSQQLLEAVPVWGALRYWEKMVGPLTACIALAAGAGVDAIAERHGRLDRAAWLTGAAIAGLPIAGGALLIAFADDSSALRERVGQGAVQSLAAAAALLTTLVLCRRAPSRLGPGLAGVVLATSVAASPYALHAGDPSVLAVHPPPLAAAAPGPRIVAPLGFDFGEGANGLDAIDRLQWWEGRSGRASTNVAAGLDSLPVYTGLTSVRWEMVIGSGDLFWPLARRFATTHLLARPPASPLEAAALQAATSGAAAPRSSDGGELLIWALPSRPWATFAASVRAVPGLELAGAALGEEVASGRETVVVETADAPAASPGRVLSASRGTDVVHIEAESDAEALLVVNDAWAPGWHAWVDDRPADVLPADVLVRAVRFPAGRHRLVMRYDAPGLGVGALLSVVAALVVAATPRFISPSRPAAPRSSPPRRGRFDAGP